MAKYSFCLSSGTSDMPGWLRNIRRASIGIWPDSFRAVTRLVYWNAIECAYCDRTMVAATTATNPLVVLKSGSSRRRCLIISSICEYVVLYLSASTDISRSL